MERLSPRESARRVTLAKSFLRGEINRKEEFYHRMDIDHSIADRWIQAVSKANGEQFAALRDGKISLKPLLGILGYKISRGRKSNIKAITRSVLGIPIGAMLDKFWMVEQYIAGDIDRDRFIQDMDFPEEQCDQWVILYLSVSPDDKATIRQSPSSVMSILCRIGGHKEVPSIDKNWNKKDMTRKKSSTRRKSDVVRAGKASGEARFAKSQEVRMRLISFAKTKKGQQMSQRELADAIGTSKASVSRWLALYGIKTQGHRAKSEDQKKRVLDMVRNGIPYRKIIEQENVSKSAISDWVKQAGISPKGNRGYKKPSIRRQTFHSDMPSRVMEMLDEGISYREIRKRTGVPLSTISRWKKDVDAGKKLKTAGETDRKIVTLDKDSDVDAVRKALRIVAKEYVSDDGFFNTYKDGSGDIEADIFFPLRDGSTVTGTIFLRSNK